MTSGGRARLRLVTAIALAALAALGTAGPPAGVAAAPPRLPQAAPPSQRVYVVSDSVGLGARSALPAAFPPGWNVVVDGQPARFVEQLESEFVRVRLATNPEWFGDHVVVAGGYNYPYWDPARFDRSIDSMIRTLTAAGVKHVYWVTLREVKPQYVTPAAWRQVQPYYWYFPAVNQHLEAALVRHRNLTLIDWAAVADRTGVTYDAIHLNTTGAALYSSIVRHAIDATTTSVPDGSTTRVSTGITGATAATVNVTTTFPRTAGNLTAHRCDRPPATTSFHNYGRGEVAAHAAIVPLDPTGDFCITSSAATNLIVDVTGSLGAASGSGSGFIAVAPTRWLDTRLRADRAPLAAGSTARLSLGAVRAGAGLPSDVAAVALSVTAVKASAPGWLRVLPCGERSETTNVNYVSAAPYPNLVIVAPDARGEICVTTSATTHVIVDLFGAFTGADDVDATLANRLFDSRESGQRLAPGATTRLDVAAAGVPKGGAAVLNLAGAAAKAAGFITAYPCADGRPTSSHLNVRPGPPASNAAVIASDRNGFVCVYNLAEMHLVIDLMGAVGAPFTASVDARVLDTRR